MSSAEHLRVFINERLAAAAEEIFGLLKTTMVEYEEEIDRQRGLLDKMWKPELKLYRIKLPQQRVCQEEEVEEETETSMLTPTCEEGDHSEDQYLYFNPDDTVNIPVIGSVIPESYTDRQLLSYNRHSEPEPTVDHQLLSYISHVVESPDQTGSTINVQLKKRHLESKTHSYNIKNSNLLNIPPFKCDTCGKEFQFRSNLYAHNKIHTDERPHSCNVCGKRFRQTSVLKAHTRIHTGEKPYSCKTCGRDFRFNSGLLVHMRTHTGEKPFTCKTCGRAFRFGGDLKVHIRRAHTGEKPYPCHTCGMHFFGVIELTRHEHMHRDKQLGTHINATPVLEKTKLKPTEGFTR